MLISITVSATPTLIYISSICHCCRVFFFFQSSYKFTLSNCIPVTLWLIFPLPNIVSPLASFTFISSFTINWSYFHPLLFYVIISCLPFHLSSVCSVSQGNVTFSCSESQPVAVTFLSATNSFLVLPTDWAAEGLSIRLQFRTWNQDGRLLTVALSQGLKSSSLLVLQLSGGAFLLSLRGTSQGTAQINTGEKKF